MAENATQHCHRVRLPVAVGDRPAPHRPRLAATQPARPIPAYPPPAPNKRTSCRSLTARAARGASVACAFACTAPTTYVAVLGPAWCRLGRPPHRHAWYGHSVASKTMEPAHEAGHGGLHVRTRTARHPQRRRDDRSRPGPARGSSNRKNATAGVAGHSDSLLRRLPAAGGTPPRVALGRLSRRPSGGRRAHACKEEAQSRRDTEDDDVRCPGTSCRPALSDQGRDDAPNRIRLVAADSVRQNLPPSLSGCLRLRGHTAGVGEGPALS